MRFVFLLFVVPVLVSLSPVASANCDEWQPGGAGGFYVFATQRTGVTIVGAHLGDAGSDIGVATCWWPERHVEVWQESNGFPGLQTGGPDCGADSFVASGTVAAGRGACVL